MKVDCSKCEKKSVLLQNGIPLCADHFYKKRGRKRAIKLTRRQMMTLDNFSRGKDDKKDKRQLTDQR